jgi:hypothetical protein
MDRSAEVEQLVVEFMARMKAADTTGMAELFVPDAATLLVGSEPADWYSGSDATIAHLVASLERYGGVPFELGAPVAWQVGTVAWVADQVTLAFPQALIPIRFTGVAVQGNGRWRFVQVHLSSGVPDMDLLES